MPSKIKVDEAAYQEKLITLNGQSLYLTLTYSTSDDVNSTGEGGWYLDLADRNKKAVINGVKILPFQNLTKRYLHVTNILGGALWCANVKDSLGDINRDNFSTDGKFQLWYFSNAEMETYGIGSL